MIAGPSPRKLQEKAFAEATRIMTRAEGQHTCCGCPETGTWTRLYCARCSRHLCPTCAGGGEWEAVCPVICCDECTVTEREAGAFLSTASTRLANGELVQMQRES